MLKKSIQRNVEFVNQRPKHPTQIERESCTVCFVAGRKTFTIQKVKLINFKIFANEIFFTATLTVFWWQANENKSWTYNESINKRTDTTHTHTHTHTDAYSLKRVLQHLRNERVNIP